MRRQIAPTATNQTKRLQSDRWSTTRIITMIIINCYYYYILSAPPRSRDLQCVRGRRCKVYNNTTNAYIHHIIHYCTKTAVGQNSTKFIEPIIVAIVRNADKYIFETINGGRKLHYGAAGRYNNGRRTFHRPPQDFQNYNRHRRSASQIEEPTISPEND